MGAPPCCLCGMTLIVMFLLLPLLLLIASALLGLCVGDCCESQKGPYPFWGVNGVGWGREKGGERWRKWERRWLCGIRKDCIKNNKEKEKKEIQ